ncbi:MAG: hypothetical protein R2822_21080 [Spirosomataceae bacterium]
MRKLILALIGLAALSWGVYECKYYGDYWLDTYQRPWAYSRDTNTPLLVGKWQGSFIDPNGIKKQIDVEIFVPTTDEERRTKASRRRRKRHVAADTRSFDGMATVSSRLGEEVYEIYGAVKKENHHQLHFNFRPQDEKKRILPNFTLLEAKEGSWQNDQLQLLLTFAYHKADGSSFWSSANPRHSKQSPTILIRQTP